MKTISDTASPMERIRNISRILKGLFLAYFIVLTGMVALVFHQQTGERTWTVYGVGYADFSSIPLKMRLLGLIGMGLFLLAVVTFFQLLNLYEKGVVFSLNNVRLYKRLGHLAFSLGLLTICAPVVDSGRLDVWTFLLGVSSSPGVIIGLIVIMVAAIMEEGCKLREESDLTV